MVKERTRTCKCCKQEVTIKPGFHNFKNLLRAPTLDEWITLFIIIMVIASAYIYKQDIEAIKEYYEGGDYCYNQRISSASTITNETKTRVISFNMDGLDVGDGG